MVRRLYFYIFINSKVDAALGSEEMVENLTERNLKLEDRIQTLEEEISDLVNIYYRFIISLQCRPSGYAI